MKTYFLFTLLFFFPTMCLGQNYYRYSYYWSTHPPAAVSKYYRMERNLSRLQLKEQLRLYQDNRSYLDKRSDRMDIAIRKYELDMRENELRNEGVLPKKKKPRTIIDGKAYSSYAEYYNTPEMILKHPGKREF